MVVLAVHKGNGVYDKVVVQTFGIEVGGNDDLKPFAPHLLGKFYPKLVRLLRRDLALHKTLVAVIADDFAPVVKLHFGYHHFLSGGGGVAVHTGHKKLFLCFGVVGGVFHHVTQSLQVGFGVFRVDALFRVFGIVNRVVEPATHIPDFADRHYSTLCGSRYLFRISI